MHLPLFDKNLPDKAQDYIVANVTKLLTNITSPLIRKRRRYDIRLADSEERGKGINKRPGVWNFPER
ncbi:MAG: hypothetical protein QME21_12230 [Anaerolineales bacterium]|nr:hypothetical protein [Anaerolineales bacterium]